MSSIYGSGVSIAQSGGTPSVDTDGKALILIDYEGTPLYAYTKAEALALTALPSIAGTHDNMSFVSWNYNLSEIQNYIANNDELEVGALYELDKTRLFFVFPNAESATLNLNVYLVSNSFIVDWGDGTVETKSTTGEQTLSHSYSFNSYPASVIVSFTATVGRLRLGNGRFFALFGETQSDYQTYYPSYYRQCSLLVSAEIAHTIMPYTFYKCVNLEKVALDYRVKPGESSFYECKSLRCVVGNSAPPSTSYSPFYGCKLLVQASFHNSQDTSWANNMFANSSLKKLFFPSEISQIPSGLCQNNESLSKIIIPNSVSAINSNAFQNTALYSMLLPNSITTIDSNAFSSCLYLSQIVIPSSVRTIKSYAFYGCAALKIIDLSNLNTVPTLSSVNAFTSISSDAVFYVKNQEMLDAFSAATNWSTYASKMQIKGAA